LYVPDPFIKSVKEILAVVEQQSRLSLLRDVPFNAFG
jgi:hypothetical protein